MKDDAKRRNAVVRVLAGKSTPKDEAQALGISERQVQRMVEAHRKVLEAVPKASAKVSESVTSGDVSPPPEATKNPALEGALKGAGEAPQDEKAKTITPGDVQLAQADMEKFVTDSYTDIRRAAGATLVQVKFSPPLEIGTPEVQRALEPGPHALLALRTNAGRLYPYFVKLMNGWLPLAIALGSDVIGMMAGLKGLAVSKGWTPPQKLAADDEQAPPPPRRGAAPPPAPVKPKADAPPKDGSVVDAPSIPLPVEAPPPGTFDVRGGLVDAPAA